MADSYAANAFASNFMTGFSFVDEIKRRKKADARLETRLDEERKERAFQKRRQIKSDQRVNTLFSQQQEDRVDSLEEERLREEGDQFALQNPDATAEELVPYAAHSPEAAASLKRINETGRLNKAFRGAQTIGFAGQPSNVAGDDTQDLAPGLSNAVTGQQQPPVNMTDSERAEYQKWTGQPAPGTQQQPAGFTFAGDQGETGMHAVSEEEFNRWSKSYQEKGFFGKIGDVVGGQAAQTVNAARDVGVAVQPHLKKAGGSAAVGQQFTGEVNLPAEFTTPEEFEAMRGEGKTEVDIQAAAERNFEIAAEYEKGAKKPGAFNIGSFSRQGNVLDRSSEALREAEARQNAAEKNATSFLDPSTTGESLIGQLAAQDPKAAAVAYLEMRETLRGNNQTLANEMDAAMVPILDQAEDSLTAEIQTMDVNSPTGRRAMQSLANLQQSRDAVYRNQPSIFTQASIKPAGIKIGDNVRVQDTLDVMFNPNSPAPTQNTNAAVNTAATVAGRISPTKRLNSTQIESLATLAQAGWIDKQTAMSVMMTGHWPPGKNPNGIKKIQETGDTVYGITNDDQYFVIQGAKNDLDKMPNREINDEKINWVRDGIRSKFPNMEDRNIAQLENILYTNPGWVRSRFNVTSQEDMRKLGAMIAESHTLAGNKYAKLKDGWAWFDGNTKDAPTLNQILMNNDLRDTLANEFEMTYIPVPENQDYNNLDEEKIRQGARDGRFGPTATTYADKYTEDQLLQVYAKWKYTGLDKAGRLDVDRNGNVTILPEQQAP